MMKKNNSPMIGLESPHGNYYNKKAAATTTTAAATRLQLQAAESDMINEFKTGSYHSFPVKSGQDALDLGHSNKRSILRHESTGGAADFAVVDGGVDETVDAVIPSTTRNEFEAMWDTLSPELLNRVQSALSVDRDNEDDDTNSLLMDFSDAHTSFSPLFANPSGTSSTSTDEVSSAAEFEENLDKLNRAGDATSNTLKRVKHALSLPPTSSVLPVQKQAKGKPGRPRRTAKNDSTTTKVVITQTTTETPTPPPPSQQQQQTTPNRTTPFIVTRNRSAASSLKNKTINEEKFSVPVKSPPSHQKKVDEATNAKSNVFTSITTSPTPSARALHSSSHHNGGSKRTEFESTLLSLDVVVLSRVVYEVNILLNGKVRVYSTNPTKSGETAFKDEELRPYSLKKIIPHHHKTERNSLTPRKCMACSVRVLYDKSVQMLMQKNVLAKATEFAESASAGTIKTARDFVKAMLHVQSEVFDQPYEIPLVGGGL